MEAQTARVFEIVRGTMHDGPGMRTTVFFKGCPLNCRWCQNPEGIKPGQDIWWEERQCIRCLACKAACPAGAVSADENGLRLDRSKCNLCGTCVEACPSQALSLVSREWTLDLLVAEALKDRDYYRAFGGGVTASGGEPLCQYKFVAEFFKRLKAKGVSTALDTCGLAPGEAWSCVLPHADCVLYDIKFIDPGLHKTYTGQSSEIILENLIGIAGRIRDADHDRNRGNQRAVKLWIRTPLVPDATAMEENITAISRFIRDNLLDVVERWELCAFNSVCNSKYQKLGRTWEYAACPLMRQAVIDNLKTLALSTGIPGEKLVVSGFRE